MPVTGKGGASMTPPAVPRLAKAASLEPSGRNTVTSVAAMVTALMPRLSRWPAAPSKTIRAILPAVVSATARLSPRTIRPITSTSPAE